MIGSMVKRLALLSVVTLAVVPAASARDPHSETLRPVAADAAVARTLLLGRANVPAVFKDKGVDRSDNSNANCSSFNPDLHKYVETADVSGHDFERSDTTGYALVSSGATVFRSRADALGDWNDSFANPKVRACIAELLRKGAGASATLTQLRVTPIDLHVAGMTMKVWDATALVNAHGRSVPFELVVGGYLRGRAVSALLMLSVAGSITEELSSQFSASMSASLARAQTALGT